MVNHLQHAPGNTFSIESKYTEHYKAEVGDRGIGDQLFHVFLHHGNKCGVDNTDNSKRGDQWSKLVGGFRKQRDGKAHITVGTHFQQDSGEDNRTGRWCFRMRIGQPSMKREHRDLDGKCEGKGKEKPDLRSHIKFEAEELQQTEVGDACFHSFKIQEDQRYQHQERSDHRVYEEFNRGINFIFSTQDTDHEVHRNQHYFPEYIEQEQVKRDERTQHAGFKQQQADHVLFHLFFNSGERRKDSDRHDKRSEYNEPQTDTVNSDIVAHYERSGSDPWQVLGKLELGV